MLNIFHYILFYSKSQEILFNFLNFQIIYSLTRLITNKKTSPHKDVFPFCLECLGWRSLKPDKSKRRDSNPQRSGLNQLLFHLSYVPMSLLDISIQQDGYKKPVIFSLCAVYILSHLKRKNRKKRKNFTPLS